MPSLSLHDTRFNMDYATRESREATFIPFTKRTKVGWPHKTPTAADLARAGFYYKPSPQSNDNTVCFMCSRNLDGWEAEDDPVQEHLKHAEDCGWAIMMNVEAQAGFDTSNMEDPTGQQLTDARRVTFVAGWPHENKRGWTCKTEKMVEAGWYFAPTTGSEDYVSCAYCKLSLDGWEPKDNPFEEHFSRSPSCPFFVFAGTTAPSKRPKAKKGRTSRASRTSKASTRLSTQSNLTVQSEAPSIPDLDESIDTSVVSIMSTASTATTKGKRKAANGRAKTGKTKKARTTKSKKVETPEMESQTHTSVSEEMPAIDVAYPEITQPVALEESRADQPTTEIKHEALVHEVSTPISPEHLTGPPELPPPSIPVSAESPGSRLSQRIRTEASPIAIKQKTVIQKSTPPPALRSSPSQTSDVENAPPSTRSESKRPPLSSPGNPPPKWEAVDVEMVFESLNEPTAGIDFMKTDLTDTERQMSVQEWIRYMATKAEDQLRSEGERVVGIFEKEGQRALTVLEGIACV